MQAECERQLELAPQEPQALAELAALLLQAGDSPRAQVLLLRALAALEARCDADPLDVAALVQRGGVLARLGRDAEALDALDAAAALDPDDYAAAVALANALLCGNDFSRAAAAARRAVALAPPEAPNRAALRSNLAAALNRVHRYRESCAVLDEMVAQDGERADALCNLANAQVCLGEQEAGVATARRACALDPEAHLPRRTLAAALAYHPETTGAAMLAAARHAAANAAPPGVPPWRPRDPRGAGRRLRVGLLSAALKTHPVGWLTVAGFEALDRRQFALVCLGQAESADPMQRRFRAAAEEWHVVDALPPAERVARLRALELDLVIEMGGYGDQGMIGACAARVAPVQVKWVGMQSHSTGTPGIDWMLTDRWETPAELAPLYSERLLTLPDGYVCYAPPPHAPALAPLPALARGHATFGCFNNLAKITPRVVAAWAAILRDLPHARLVLKTHQFDDRATCDTIAAKFAAHGTAADRVECRGASSHRALLAEYADIDIVLDPFPYCGGLTTCEALWMGVPVVTMPGDTFASRHSASHLCNVGLDDWVAADLAAYHALALRRAADLPALAALRAGLRQRMRASPLCDAARFGAGLGAALRHAWHDWCGRPGVPRTLAPTST